MQIPDVLKDRDPFFAVALSHWERVARSAG
jgi:hypothetical protein